MGQKSKIIARKTNKSWFCSVNQLLSFLDGYFSLTEALVAKKSNGIISFKHELIVDLLAWLFQRNSEHCPQEYQLKRHGLS